MGCASTLPTNPADASLTPESVPETESSKSVSEQVPRISQEELLHKIEEGADFLLVDTRTEGEYEVDYIKGAISVPLTVITAGEWLPPTDKEVILYCA